MHAILTKLFPEPALDPGETIVKSWLANRTQSPLRAVGGKLYLTTHRLTFEPHVVDARLRGQRWSAPLARIARVAVQPRETSGFHLFDGGLRARLRVEETGGEPQFFVVNEVEKLQQELAGTVAAKA